MRLDETHRGDADKSSGRSFVYEVSPFVISKQNYEEEEVGWLENF